MRILFYSSVFPAPDHPVHGIYCLTLLRSLAVDHEVQAIVPRPWPRVVRNRTGRGARMTAWLDSIGFPLTYVTFVYPPRLWYNSHGWWMWWSSRRAVRRLLGEFRPDCVLSYWVHPDGEAATRIARSLQVPVGVIVGGSDVLLDASRSPARRRRFAATLRALDAVFSVSRDLSAKVIAMGVEPARSRVSYQGVDPALFHPGDRNAARERLGIPLGGPVLLWVGRMVPVKGLNILLQSCGELRDAGVEFQVYLLGDGPLRPAIEAEAAALGLKSCVEFAGPQPQESLPDWYRACDLVVLPSLSEGIPNVLRECQACGRPFAASRVGGIPEITDPATSELFEPGSAATMTAAVRVILARPERPVATQSVTWEESARDLASQLQTLIDRR